MDFERPTIIVEENTGCCKSGWRIIYTLRNVKKINKASAEFKEAENGSYVIEMWATADGTRKFFGSSNEIPGPKRRSMKIVKTSKNGGDYNVDIEGADPSDLFH